MREMVSSDVIRGSVSVRHDILTDDDQLHVSHRDVEHAKLKELLPDIRRKSAQLLEGELRSLGKKSSKPAPCSAMTYLARVKEVEG